MRHPQPPRGSRSPSTQNLSLPPAPRSERPLESSQLADLLADTESSLKFEDLSDAQQRSPKLVVAALKGEKLKAYQVPDALLSNKEVMLEVCSRAPRFLEFASRELRGDPEVVLAAVNSREAFRGNSLLQFASMAVRADREFVTELVTARVGGVVEFASEEIRDSEEILKTACEHGEGGILRFMSERIRSDRDLVLLAAASSREPLLNYLSEEMAADPEVATAALSRSSDNYFSLSEQQLGDESLLLTATGRNPELYRMLPEELQQRSDFARAHLSVDPYGLSEIHSDVLSDEAFVAEMLARDSRGFGGLPDQMKQNPRFILAAVRDSAKVLAEVPVETLRDSPELQRAIARENVLSEIELRSVLGELAPEVQTIYDSTRTVMSLLGFSQEVWSKSEDAYQGRMDNSREIIRNRFSVANQGLQSQMLALLGEDYFSGALEPDPRPTVLVLMNESDGNGAFGQNDGIFSRNNVVDQLTERHRVLYYETADETELRAALQEATKDKTVPAAHLVLGYHGTKQLMDLGARMDPETGKVEFSSEESRLLDIYDRDMRESFAGSVQENGSIYLISCSTGEGALETPGIVDNVAEYLHGVLPDTTLYAPTRPVTVPRIIDPQSGELMAPVAPFADPENSPVLRMDPLQRLDSNADVLDARLRGDVYSILEQARPEYTLVSGAKANEADLRYWGGTIKTLATNDPEKPAQLLAAEELLGLGLIKTINDPEFAGLWGTWAEERNFDDPKKLAFDRRLAETLGLSAERVETNYAIGGLWEIYIDGKKAGSVIARGEGTIRNFDLLGR